MAPKALGNQWVWNWIDRAVTVGKSTGNSTVLFRDKLDMLRIDRGARKGLDGEGEIRGEFRMVLI